VRTVRKRWCGSIPLCGRSRKVLSVPREEIVRREAEYKHQSAANPNRRGPKLRNRLFRVASSRESG